MAPALFPRIALPLLAALLLAACQAAYYDALERIGIEKRDLLVDRVEAAQESQEDAQEEFRDALEQFRSVVDFDGGELEDRYDSLSGSYDDAQDQAKDVLRRIAAVDRVGRDLFDEWETELDEYQSADLRNRSAAQLRDTRTNFDSMLGAMQRAAERMDPVLELFQDQVLFLKHNLNATAVASLDAERATIEARVEALIEEMEAAIREAEQFINVMT